MDINYKEIGKRIKLYRIKQDIQQDALAEKADLSVSHMSNIETGKTKLSLPTIISIANALGVSVDDLLCDNVVHSKPVFEREIAEIFDDCSVYEIRVITQTVNGLKASLRKNKKFIKE